MVGPVDIGRECSQPLVIKDYFRDLDEWLRLVVNDWLGRVPCPVADTTVNTLWMRADLR